MTWVISDRVDAREAIQIIHHYLGRKWLRRLYPSVEILGTVYKNLEGLSPIFEIMLLGYKNETFSIVARASNPLNFTQEIRDKIIDVGFLHHLMPDGNVTWIKSLLGCNKEQILSFLQSLIGLDTTVKLLIPLIAKYDLKIEVKEVMSLQQLCINATQTFLSTQKLEISRLSEIPGQLNTKLMVGLPSKLATQSVKTLVYSYLLKRADMQSLLGLRLERTANRILKDKTSRPMDPDNSQMVLYKSRNRN